MKFLQRELLNMCWNWSVNPEFIPELTRWPECYTFKA